MFEEKVQSEYSWTEVAYKPFQSQYRLILALFVAIDMFIVIYGFRYVRTHYLC